MSTQFITERRQRNYCPKCQHGQVTYRYNGKTLEIHCLNDDCRHKFVAQRTDDRRNIMDMVGNE